MKKTFCSVLLTVFTAFILAGCDAFRSDAKIKSVAATPTPTIENPAIGEKNVEDDDQNSPDCVRAKPEPIINKEVFPKTAFKLEKNNQFPFEYRGYETVEFENGDKLLIENVGCENYTQVFHFETGRFSGRTNDAKFWYQTAAELIAQTLKGIREPQYISDQMEALNSYIKKNKKLKFNEEIEVGGEGIKENVLLEKVKKLAKNRVEIVLHFDTGPL